MFSKSTISKSAEFREALGAINHDRVHPKLSELAKSGDPADMFSLTREYSMDVVTAFLYGLDKGTDWLGHPTEASYYLSAFRETVEAWVFFAFTEIPRLTEMLHRFKINIVPTSFFASSEVTQKFVFDLTSGVIRSWQAGKGQEDNSSKPFYQIWRRLGDMPETQKTCLLASDAFDQLHAGHGAIGITLTFIMWELSRNSDIQKRLREELRSLRNAGQSPEQSQFLDNVITETVRLYPAGGGPFFRLAPTNAKLAGFDIPARTIVSAVPYTLGRNLQVFPDPESWRPERWGGVSAEEKKRMKEWVWAFLSGSRVCIAEYLSMESMSRRAGIEEFY